MATQLPQPLAYLDKALGALRELGLVSETRGETPMLALLEQISELDRDRVALIARTLGHLSVFNEAVREQVSGMAIGQRYQDVASAFNSIRDDARSLVEQIEDGRIDTRERLANIWQKVTRGDISSRFEKIKATYLGVNRDALTRSSASGGFSNPIGTSAAP